MHQNFAYRHNFSQKIFKKVTRFHALATHPRSQHFLKYLKEDRKTPPKKKNHILIIDLRIDLRIRIEKKKKKKKLLHSPSRTTTVHCALFTIAHCE